MDKQLRFISLVFGTDWTSLQIPHLETKTIKTSVKLNSSCEQRTWILTVFLLAASFAQNSWHLFISGVCRQTKPTVNHIKLKLNLVLTRVASFLKHITSSPPMWNQSLFGWSARTWSISWSTMGRDSKVQPNFITLRSTYYHWNNCTLMKQLFTFLRPLITILQNCQSHLYYLGIMNLWSAQFP